MFRAGLPPPPRPIAVKTACRDDRSTSVRLSAVNQEPNAERSICASSWSIRIWQLCAMLSHNSAISAKGEGLGMGLELAAAGEELEFLPGPNKFSEVGCFFFFVGLPA